MKTLLPTFALAIVALTSLTAHADVISDGINVTINGNAVVGVYNPLLQEDIFTDTITNVGALNSFGVLSESVSTITGTYTDVAGVLGNLVIADVCESVTVLGSTSTPCSDVAVVATATGLTGVASAQTLTLLGGNIVLLPNGFNSALATVAIGSANGSLNFTPPGGAGVSPVPEPASLSLMATGLAAVGGVVRRRLIA